MDLTDRFRVDTDSGAFEVEISVRLGDPGVSLTTSSPTTITGRRHRRVGTTEWVEGLPEAPITSTASFFRRLHRGGSIARSAAPIV